MLAFPLILETKFIIEIWIGEVSEYMVVFTRLLLIYVILLTMSTPITIIVQAANKVKLYHGIVDGFALISLPISYFVYKLSFPAAAILGILLIVFAVAHIFRLIILSKVTNFLCVDYIRRILLPISAVILTTVLLNLINIWMLNKMDVCLFLTFALHILMVELQVIVMIFIFGINCEEKLKIKRMILEQCKSLQIFNQRI